MSQHPGLMFSRSAESHEGTLKQTHGFDFINIHSHKKVIHHSNVSVEKIKLSLKCSGCMRDTKLCKYTSLQVFLVGSRCL